MKLRTSDDILDALNAAYGWRLQELSSINSLMRKSTGRAASPLIRAGIPILYAHWEGFVKQSAIAFADYLSSQRLSYGEVAVSFSGLKAHNYVLALADIKKWYSLQLLCWVQLDQ
jgi:hypothetical protein